MSKTKDKDLPLVPDLADAVQAPLASGADDWDQLFDPEAVTGEFPEADVEEAEVQDAPPPSTRYLGFRLGTEHYAVPILHLSEVVRFQEITSVPRVRSFVRGLISVRGTIVPIVDLKQRLAKVGRRDEAGAPSGPPDEEADEAALAERRVLITQHDGDVFGLLVDAVSDVFVADLSEIEPPPATLPRRLLEFVSGIARVQGRIHTVLEVSSVLRFQAVAAQFQTTEAAR